jgi:hypothetical protein
MTKKLSLTTFSDWVTFGHPCKQRKIAGFLKGAKMRKTIRYDYNAQPNEDQLLSGGNDRWCNNLNTILVP